MGGLSTTGRRVAAVTVVLQQHLAQLYLQVKHSCKGADRNTNNGKKIEKEGKFSKTQQLFASKMYDEILESCLMFCGRYIFFDSLGLEKAKEKIDNAFSNVNVYFNANYTFSLDDVEPEVLELVKGQNLQRIFGIDY